MIYPEFIIVGLLGAIYTGTAAQPAVVTESVLAQVGTVARFNCTAMHNEPVYWTTKPYGSQATHDIYIGERLLLDDYGASGRFSVEVDSTLRRYDLVIKDIKQSDGGVYICVDERGLGQKAYAELIVWDALTCQNDQPRDSYMGDNVFDLDQDTISFTCRMSYSGNIRPQFVWSVGGRKLNGTQGTESGFASSSLILIATSKLGGSTVTCEAFIQGNSGDEVRSSGVLWRSDIIKVKYAVLKKEAVEECPGVENTLNCNPPCSYILETINGAQRCAVGYTVRSEVNWFYVYRNSPYNSETGSRYSIVMSVLAAVSSFVLITLALRYLIKKLRLGSKMKNRNVEDKTLKTMENNIMPIMTLKQNPQTQEERKNETTVFMEKMLPVLTYPISDNKIESTVMAAYSQSVELYNVQEEPRHGIKQLIDL